MTVLFVNRQGECSTKEIPDRVCVWRIAHPLPLSLIVDPVPAQPVAIPMEDFYPTGEYQYTGGLSGTFIEIWRSR